MTQESNFIQPKDLILDLDSVMLTERAETSLTGNKTFYIVSL
jgi:hypothetical protein